MTIVVSVKVSEGLVLAGDSTAAMHGTIRNENGVQAGGILKTYDHARKLSHMKDYPVGTLTWGISQIGSRTVESLIKEFEYGLPSLEEENEKIRERRMRGENVESISYEYDVGEISQGLLEHVTSSYDGEFSDVPDESKPPLGILVSGYSFGKFFPDQWLLNLPSPGTLQELRPDIDEKPSFGANWFGLTDAIVRLHWGRDDQALDILSKRFEVDREEIIGLLNPLQYPVPFEGMPLQDAIDYAVYLINVAIGRFRFVVGAPLCGGEIDVAVIIPNSFSWVRKKSWKL
ncbi:MAG: hypothetical protein E3J86_01460 [Candidatus Thorarchaeota archaeon]|nr:MAG: hypothetical protein E3J86_01460 [Candidatus Thorarchaeota archaeon]